MVHFMELQFDDNFHGEQFLRNNRSTGQKSLRCFPRCCDQGHKAQGFCGSPIYATAVFQKTSVPLERVMIVGEIRPELEPGLAKDVGSRLPKEEILNCIRSESNKKSPESARAELLPGEFRILSETAETYSVGIVLNEALHSYDYSWKSNRWASGTVTHVVDVIALSDDSLGKAEPGPHTITVLTSASSAPFVVASTKKSTATAIPTIAGEKRKQAPARVSVGPSQPRGGYKDKRHPFQQPMAEGGEDLNMEGSSYLICYFVDFVGSFFFNA